MSATFREAFKGLQDYLVEKMDLDSSLLLSKLQATEVITDYQRRLLDEVCDIIIVLRHRSTVTFTIVYDCGHSDSLLLFPQ